MANGNGKSFIKIKEKPSVPTEKIGRDAFGKVPTFVDRGVRKRIICGSDSLFFLIKKCFFSIYHQVSPLYIIRYMLICKNNSKFAYKLLSADGVYVNN